MLSLKHRLKKVSRGSRRKLALFGCACIYEIWDLLVDVRSKNAIIAVAGFADGCVTSEELQNCFQEARGMNVGPFHITASYFANYAAYSIIWASVTKAPSFWKAYATCANDIRRAAMENTCNGGVAADIGKQMLFKQHQLFNEIFGK